MAVILRVSGVMYYLTLMALVITLLYRQFVLDQPLEAYQDIANILTVNSLVFIGLILYLGGITIPRMTIRSVVAFYLVFVALGFAFTMFKYTVLLGEPLSISMFLENLKIVSGICGILVLIWALLAYFGNRRIEKKIGD
jgi:hypothetical protein